MCANDNAKYVLQLKWVELNDLKNEVIKKRLINANAAINTCMKQYDTLIT